MNEKCKSLAKKIREIIDTKSSFSDWLNNSNIRNQLKQDIKICLVKNGYPPQYSSDVFREVMGQVENYKENSEETSELQNKTLNENLKESYAIAVSEPFEVYAYSDFEASPQQSFDETLLVGYFKNKSHRDWILSNKIYNVRIDNRPGTVKEFSNLFDTTKTLVLYGPLNEDKKIRIFKILSHKPETGEEMRERLYPDAEDGKLYELFEIQETSEDSKQYTDLIEEIRSKQKRYKKPVFITTQK